MKRKIIFLTLSLFSFCLLLGVGFTQSADANVPGPKTVTCIGCPYMLDEECTTCDYNKFQNYCCGCAGSSDDCGDLGLGDE